MRRVDVASAEAIYAEMQWRSRTDDVSQMTLAVVADAIALAFESVPRSDFTLLCWTRRASTREAFRPHPRYAELLRAMGV